MKLREFTAIMIAAAMVTSALYVTNHQPTRVSGAFVASPLLAVQLSTDPNQSFREHPFTPDSPWGLGWFSNWFGGMMGSFAGIFAAQQGG